jgi:hypothetical protein
MSLSVQAFAEHALAYHAKMGSEVMQELGLNGAPTETEYYKLLIAKMYKTEPTLSEKEVEGPNGILKEVEAEEPAVAAQDTLRAEAKVIARTPAVELTSGHIKKNVLKFKKKQVGADGDEEEVEVSADFPYLAGVDYSSTCQSLKICGGLLSPCLTRRPKGQDFCKACTKIGNPHGTIQDRKKVSMLCYKSPKGKAEMSFGTYVTKRGLDIEEVKAAIGLKYGITLPNEYWSVDKVKASRVVKTVSTSSDDEASVENGAAASDIAKKRGRPSKKPAEPVSEEKPAEPVSEEKPAEPVSEEKPAEPVSEEKPKKVKNTKKVKKTPEEESPKKESVHISVEEDEELEEEPHSDDETPLPSDKLGSLTSSVRVSRGTWKPEPAGVKNGDILKKLESGDFVLAWDDKTYVVDQSDNTVWTHESATDYGLVESVGEWNPETKTIEWDEE